MLAVNTAKSTLEVTGATTLNGNLTTNGAVDFKNLPTCATQASSDNQLVNLATLKKQVPLLGGINFTGIKVVGLTSGVNYTNNTGKALFFYVSLSASKQTIGGVVPGAAYIDGVQVLQLAIDVSASSPSSSYGVQAGAIVFATSFLIVPNGKTYKFVGIDNVIQII